MAGINACYQLLSPEEKQQFAREMESWQKEQDKQTTPIAPVYFHGNATCNGEKIPHIFPTTAQLTPSNRRTPL